MANILDYLDWRGDLTLAERGFNEYDQKHGKAALRRNSPPGA